MPTRLEGAGYDKKKLPMKPPTLGGCCKKDDIKTESLYLSGTANHS